MKMDRTRSNPTRRGITYPTIVESVKVSTAATTSAVATVASSAVSAHVALGQVHQGRGCLVAPVVPQQLQQVIGQLTRRIGVVVTPSATTAAVVASPTSAAHVVVVSTASHAPVVGGVPGIHITANGAAVVVAVKVTVAVSHLGSRFS